jgi:hypothetical protein
VPHVVLALLGACLFVGYRMIARTVRELAAQIRAEEERRERTSGPVVARDLGPLEYDAASGVYRPAKRS